MSINLEIFKIQILIDQNINKNMFEAFNTLETKMLKSVYKILMAIVKMLKKESSRKANYSECCHCLVNIFGIFKVKTMVTKKKKILLKKFSFSKSRRFFPLIAKGNAPNKGGEKGQSLLFSLHI